MTSKGEELLKQIELLLFELRQQEYQSVVRQEEKTFNENYLSQKEACKRYDITPPTIKKYRESGIIKYKNVGKDRFFYNEEDVLMLAKMIHPGRF